MLVYTDTSKNTKGESVESNKYYGGKIVQVSNSQWAATVSWGRIGTAKGQSKTETFHSEYEAKQFIEDKFYEKRSKGYREVDDNEYRRLVGIAQLVGLNNKVGQNFWMEKVGLRWERVRDDQRLMDPTCKPGFFVEFTDGKAGSTHGILFTAQGTFVRPTDATSSQNFSDLVGINHPLNETVAKVHKAMFAAE